MQLRYEVSIPKRVSEALKLEECDRLNPHYLVSIPKRVSEALKPSGTLANSTALPFQSLKGFQRL